MIRIVEVLATSTGGIGRHVASLVSELVADGYDVTVAGPAATDELFGFRAHGARFVDVPLGAGLSALAAARSTRLREIIRGADVVHAHGLRAGLIGSLLVRRRSPGPRVVVSWHNAPLGRGVGRAVHVVMERFVARRADVTLAASGDLADRARAAGGRDVRVVPVATAATAAGAAPSRAEIRAEFGLDERPVVVAVGRLHVQKRLDVLVDAAARTAELVPDLAVLVVGEGPARPALERQIGDTGAPVRLLGQRADAADVIGAADVVALPSQWEARSLVAQEALLAGRALVTTPVGGIPELVGDAAVLVPVGDATALAEALVHLLGDPAARADLERRATERARMLPTARDTVAAVEDVYRELSRRVS